MAFFAGLGSVIVGAIAGASAAAAMSTIVLGAIGGAVVGAAVGALYSAFTGGNILKGALYGALGGAVIGGAGAGLAGMFSGAGTGASAGGLAYAGKPAATVVAKTAAEGGLFAASNMGSYATAIASLGSAFLKGGVEGSSADAQIQAEKDMQEKQLEAQREMAAAANEAAIAQAEIAAGASATRVKSAERIAAADRAFSKEKFEKEFEESKYRDRTDREEAEAARLRQEQGIVEGSEYVAGHTQTISPLEVNRKRQDLLRPKWFNPAETTAGATATAPEMGLTPGGAAPAPPPPAPGFNPQQPGLLGIS